MSCKPNIVVRPYTGQYSYICMGVILNSFQFSKADSSANIPTGCVSTGALLSYNAPLPANSQWCTSRRGSRRRRGSVNRACGGGAAALHNISRTQLCCVVQPMGEVVPAKPTELSTCAHQSRFRIRVQVNERTDHMSQAWIRGNLKWAKHETAAPTLFRHCVAMAAQLLCCQKPWSVMIMWGSNNSNQKPFLTANASSCSAFLSLQPLVSGEMQQGEISFHHVP